LCISVKRRYFREKIVSRKASEKASLHEVKRPSSQQRLYDAARLAESQSDDDRRGRLMLLQLGNSKKALVAGGVHTTITTLLQHLLKIDYILATYCYIETMFSHRGQRLSPL
jgi:hypothetical protein